MKNYKLFLILFFTLLYLNSYSQVFIGGNIYLNSSSHSTVDNKLNYHDFTISPNFGKYISEKLALGVSLKYSNSQNKMTSQESTYSSVGVSPFLRYDVFKMGKFAVYGQGNIGIAFLKQKPYNTTVETKSIQTYISFYPGVSYNLNDHFMLQTVLNFLSLRYEYSESIKSSPKQTSSLFYFNSSLSDILSTVLSIGAIYRF